MLVLTGKFFTMSYDLSFQNLYVITRITLGFGGCLPFMELVHRCIPLLGRI